jgi:hypothetical protein
VPSLFGKPQQYCDFLGQEIQFYYKRTLLVVMPNGYGLRGPGETAAARAALRSVPRPKGTTPAALADAARAAVRAIAAANGHPLGEITPVHSSGGASGSGNRGDGGAIVVAVALVLAAVLAVGAFFAGRRWLLKPE